MNDHFSEISLWSIPILLRYVLPLVLESVWKKGAAAERLVAMPLCFAESISAMTPRATMIPGS